MYWNDQFSMHMLKVVVMNVLAEGISCMQYIQVLDIN